MDLDRIKNISLPAVAPSIVDPDVEQALNAVYNSLYAMRLDLARSPGVCNVTASVGLSKGDAIQIFNGQARLADQSTGRPAIGICLANAGAGSKARIMLGTGYINGLVGLTANSSYYLSVAGAITTVKPGAGLVQGIGYSLSTTELFLTISQP